MTEHSPFFTIVTPCFNAEKTLLETIASVRAQTETDWELCLVNDGSTDDTLRLAQAAANQDRRIHVVDKPNQGVSAARNAGIALAKGRVVAFLDADDGWMPDALARHRVRFETDENLAVSYARIAFGDAHLTPLGRVSASPPSVLTPATALGENPICTGSNLLVRREAFARVGGFDETLRHAEDQEWLFRALVALGAGAVVGLDAVLVIYRANPEGLHGNLAAMEQSWETMMARAALTAPDIVRLHRSRAKALHLRLLARRALRVPTQSGAALPMMLRALRQHPPLLWESRRTLQTLAGALAVACVPGARGRAALVRWFQ
ncbi:MAG: glycosyltransferase family A protein [Pseudomonadota bacterium]